MKVNTVFSLILLTVLLVPASLFGEYNPITGREELLLISTGQEIGMGLSISRQLEKRYSLVEDNQIQDRVERIGEKLVEVCDRKELIYHFKALEVDDINAVSLPGGWVYVFKGLIDKVKSDDELAGVIAHEIGHIAARHSVRRLQTSLASNVFMVLVAATQRGDVARGADLALTSLMAAYSREDELEADRRAVIYTRAAGYDPNAIISFMDTMKEAKKFNIRPYSYFRTHPYDGERMGEVRREITGVTDFNTWINRPLDRQ